VLFELVGADNAARFAMAIEAKASTRLLMKRKQLKTIRIDCTVNDCTGKPPMTDVTVVIESYRIVELKPGVCEAAPGEGAARLLLLTTVC
jgi:hypothetical protein